MLEFLNNKNLKDALKKRNEDIYSLFKLCIPRKITLTTIMSDDMYRLQYFRTRNDNIHRRITHGTTAPLHGFISGSVKYIPETFTFEE